MQDKCCLHCGKPIRKFYRESASHFERRKFCNNECRNAAKKKPLCPHCGDPIKAKGVCDTLYQQFRRTGRMPYLGTKPESFVSGTVRFVAGRAWSGSE